MAVRSQVEVFDEGGVLLCTNRCTTLFPTLGGYGGQPMDRRASRIPDRAPDFVARDHIGAAQHLLYRLTGDTNLVHVDRAVAERRGLQGPFVHDLCLWLCLPAGHRPVFPRPAGEAAADVRGHENRPLSRHPGGTPPVADWPPARGLSACERRHRPGHPDRGS